MDRLVNAFRGGILGAAAGAFGAILLAVLLAPSANPTQPTQHEWYTPVAIFYACCATIGGGVIGMFQGAFSAYAARIGMWVGLMAGGLVGWLCIPTGPYAIEYVIPFALAGAFLGSLAGSILQASLNKSAH